MSESSAVEIDFFRLEEESSPPKLPSRRNIQDVISKINPELLKPAIASAFANNSFVANKSLFTSPLQLQTLPVYDQDCGGAKMATSAASLTIFYNGTVSVFEVSPNQADNIMKLAQSVRSVSETGVQPTGLSAVKPETESNRNPAIGGVLSKDLPLSRKKSLKRFLEKRKERQVSASSYGSLH